MNFHAFEPFCEWLWLSSHVLVTVSVNQIHNKVSEEKEYIIAAVKFIFVNLVNNQS